MAHIEQLQNIDLSHLSENEAKEYILLLEELERRHNREAATSNFLTFVKTLWDSFIEGEHHKKMAKVFDDIAEGKTKRVIVNMAPRHTKSEFASHYFPAYLLGKKPDLKIIQATHTADLAVNFGRKIRDLIDSEEYQKLFPDTSLKADSKSAGKWNTSKGGEYFAAGVGGALAGRGADLFIIDDPHSEQDAMSEKALDDTYEWFMTGPRQRLQPGGAIVIVMTRWSKRDLTGKLIKKMATDENADQWEIIEFPAILPSGNPLWGNFWSLDELEKVKASISPSKWFANYMQQPTGGEIAIIPKEWFKIWESEDAPYCEYIIQSFDTAFLKKESADFTAVTTWGIFYPSGKIGEEYYDGKQAHIILLDVLHDRFDFPELKEAAIKYYKQWQPDSVIIEAKASGLPLTQELRAVGIPIFNFTPSRGQDKVARVNSISSILADGKVWVPQTNWAEELVEEVNDFPSGEHDDLVDSMTQALMRFRQGGFLRLSNDWADEEESSSFNNRVYY